MMNRNSTLYQLDNAMAEFHYLMLQKLDSDSWVSTNQFISYTSSSLEDVRREFENRYGSFKYPSMVMTRSPNIKFQADNNVNNATLEITQNSCRYDVRPVTLNYTMTVIDSRRKYIDEYYELLLLNMHKYAPVLDIQIKVGEQSGEDVIVHNKTLLQYDSSALTVAVQPTYDVKTAGSGQIYTLSVPFSVDTQLIGNYIESKLINQLIANYRGMKDGEFLETDTIPTVPPNNSN